MTWIEAYLMNRYIISENTCFSERNLKTLPTSFKHGHWCVCCRPYLLIVVLCSVEIIFIAQRFINFFCHDHLRRNSMLCLVAQLLSSCVALCFAVRPLCVTAKFHSFGGIQVEHLHSTFTLWIGNNESAPIAWGFGSDIRC